MAKVTNNENLRRYVHKKLSKIGENGSGEITVDSITPELLENEDILKRIQNWGLSDEEISRLHTIELNTDAVASALSCDEAILYTASIDDCTIDNVGRTAFDEIEFLSSGDEYKYLLYGSQDFSPLVIKRTYEDQGYIRYEAENDTLKIEFIDTPDFVTVWIGYSYF